VVLAAADGSGNRLHSARFERIAADNGYSVSNAVDSSGSMGVSAAIVATGNGAGIGQSTSLSGKSGSVSFSASSPNNQMAVAGGFCGDGNMNADLSAVASDRAAMSGSASIVEVSVLDDDNLQLVASGDMGLSVDGLYTLPSGDLGKFGLAKANVEKASASGTPSYLTGPSNTSSGGNSNVYVLSGWRWNSMS
jgi:hypothetical protein